MNFWWCSQGGGGWEGERRAEVVCASAETTKLTNRQTVGEVKAGDIILHYRKGYVVAFSRAKEDGKYYPKLPDLNGLVYVRGWRFRTEYHDLTPPIAKSIYVKDLIPLIVKGYPIKTDGNGNRGYFFRFDRAGIGAVLKHVAEPIPDWLHLKGAPPKEPRNDTQTREEFDSELAARIEASRSLSKAERERKMAAEPEFPKRRQVVSTEFHRSALVILTVLEDANGICEECGEKAPFLKRKDRLPYLEVHHRVPLSKGGKDKVENAVALCPNCHREEHHG